MYVVTKWCSRTAVYVPSWFDGFVLADNTGDKRTSIMTLLGYQVGKVGLGDDHKVIGVHDCEVCLY